MREVPGFAVVGHAATAAAARSQIKQLTPGLVLLDLYLPDGHGLDLVREVLEEDRRRPDFLIITAARDVASIRTAMQLGALHYLVKPFGFAQIEERLIAYRNLHARLARMTEAEQQDVDALYGLLRAPAPLPKAQSGPTITLIREVLESATTDLSAGEIAEHVGISRSTAQRYLAHLVRQGTVDFHLHYGTTGRPEHRYRSVRPR